MSPGDYVPERGHIVSLDFGAPTGREQAGRRPGLVLSPYAYNLRTGLCLVCPITSRVKGYPSEVPLPAGTKTHGVVLANAVRDCDWNVRRIDFLEIAPKETVDAVARILVALLGIRLETT